MNSEKVQSLEALAETIRQVKAAGKKVVYCHGVFDLLHPGHLQHFRDAKRMGDVLVVTTTKDNYVNKGPGRPVYNQQLRAESLAALECVDFVAVNRWADAVQTIRMLQPDVYVKGQEFKNRTDLIGHINKEAETIENIGGRMAFTGGVTFSSSKLLNRHFGLFDQPVREFFDTAKKRYTADGVISMLKGFSNLTVMVIGEAIIDEYHFCKALGKPEKSAIVSAQLLKKEAYAGGSLAVANHLAGFCKQVHLVTCLGTDGCEEFITSNLKPNIVPHFFYRDDSPTIVKRRYLNGFLSQKLFEVMFFNDTNLPARSARQVSDYLGGSLDQCDMVVATDFGHGFFTDDLVDQIATKSPFLAINVQSNSANTGFNMIDKWPRADYASIDQRELRLATHRKHMPVEQIIAGTKWLNRFETLTVTLGHEGSIIHNCGNTTKIPVFSTDVVDAIGAGDAFLSLTAPCVLKKAELPVVGLVGNAVGAMAVQIMGNKDSIEPAQLFRFINTLFK